MKTNCRKKALVLGKFTTKWHAAIASHVPVGYEDETGFHYGAKASDGFFLFFDSGEQPLFPRGSSPPPPWRLSPESAFWVSKMNGRRDADNRAL